MASRLRHGPLPNAHALPRCCPHSLPLVVAAQSARGGRCILLCPRAIARRQGCSCDSRISALRPTLSEEQTHRGGALPRSVAGDPARTRQRRKSNGAVGTWKDAGARPMAAFGALGAGVQGLRNATLCASRALPFAVHQVGYELDGRGSRLLLAGPIVQARSQSRRGISRGHPRRAPTLVRSSRSKPIEAAQGRAPRSI